ncbi:TPA: hypothetical protein ENS27_14525 [bacterium]|nr:hypothetical protein [bacterium]
MPRKKAETSAGVKEHKTKNSTKKKSIFIELTPDKYFVLCNGNTIKDYRELAALLETIGDDVFFYHVNSERNDFANWIRDVFGEEELAEKIRHSRSRHEMMALLYKHLFHKLEGICA